MAAISIDGTPMTALPSDADQINYDNTSSGMAATQVQAAVDELKNGLNSKVDITNTTNLNDCITYSGVYRFAWDATGVPTGHSGAMLVLRNANAETGLQIARVATENTIYVRFFDNAVFTAWQPIPLDVTKNGGGTSVDISGATFSNKYTFPADGYIYVRSENDTSGINKAAIIGSNGITVAYIYQPISAANDIRSLYVRKGMMFYVVQKSANASMKFTPLV